MVTDWADRLREHGYRITPQRHLVLQAIDSLGHATPEAIHDHVRVQADGVNLSTIYRTLEVLESVGLVTHTHITHGSPTYHSLEEEIHVHLVCRHCSKVDAVPADTVRPLLDALVTERGFDTDVSHLTIHGICSSCRESSTTSRG
jgi:Fur family ferric uptake transcriptional regulator